MTTSPLPLILNPAAGRGRARRRQTRIAEIFNRAGIPISEHRSRSAGDVEEQILALVEGGAENILIIGGDGTVHEAVNGIMRAGNRARLGVIPAGTGNDFAKACAIPLNWEHATRLLAQRLSKNVAPRQIDVGRMNERYFANGAGIGFDAKVTSVARSYRWPIGDFNYLLAIFRCMIDGVATPDLSIATDDLQWNGPVTLVSINSGPYVGGMFHIAPMASNDDGKLELLIADPVSRRRIVSLLPKLVQGRHMNEPEITHVSVSRVSITASAPVESHLDGEVQPLATEFEIEVLPGALEIL